MAFAKIRNRDVFASHGASDELSGWAEGRAAGCVVSVVASDQAGASAAPGTARSTRLVQVLDAVYRDVPSSVLTPIEVEFLNHSRDAFVRGRRRWSEELLRFATCLRVRLGKYIHRQFRVMLHTALPLPSQDAIRRALKVPGVVSGLRVQSGSVNGWFSAMRDLIEQVCRGLRAEGHTLVSVSDDSTCLTPGLSLTSQGEAVGLVSNCVAQKGHAPLDLSPASTVMRCRCWRTLALRGP